MVPVIIGLLITGCVLILASFLFKDSFSDDAKGKILTEKEIEKLVERRFNEVKYRLDDEAEKSADIIRDQTERELEKLSNEKIMAVNEYSDQVMDQINKNHNEVMFLYSMLSDKQKELDYAVESLNQIRRQTENEKKLEEHAQKQQETADTQSHKTVNNPTDISRDNQLKISRRPELEPANEKYTSKETIIKMHNEGYSSLEIAQQLHLGVGEVRLVIGLSKERQE